MIKIFLQKSILFAMVTVLLISCVSTSKKATVPADDFGAYYTKIKSEESFEKYSRTGDYADIIVDLGKKKGKLVFWRGSSYLPYWETKEGSWFVEEIIPRSGDGSGKMPDKVNTYSVVKIIMSDPQKVVIHWRYLPEFSGLNPHLGVDATKFVDEYFTITPEGKVTRTIRQGTSKIDDWKDPLNQITQTFELTSEGFTDIKRTLSQISVREEVVDGSHVNTGVVGTPVVWWKFDEAQGDITNESVTNTSCTVIGHKSLWRKGISGTALQFDGYNTVISFPASKAPQIASAITLEGWVVIGAYPWSWIPIAQQCDDVPEVLEQMRGDRAQLLGEDEDDDEGRFTFVLKKEDDVGYFLGINGHGYPGLKINVGGEWEELVSDKHLERRRWYHIVGTFDKNTGEMIIYVDGEVTGEKEVAQSDILLSSKDIKIGKGKDRRPLNPVRANTFIDSYSLDGLIDEVKIYDVALSSSQITQSYENFKPATDLRDSPSLDKRVLPAGESRGEFGAYYTRLNFYDVWDNLWRFSNHPDVVVEFDQLPSKFVFWRGTGYIPMMVNEKGQWYSNEFNETWNKSGGQGCQEPMSDKEGYTNHAKILENTDARVVVQWRYPLIDVLHVVANYREETGWADWADWYYYIYPDGIAVKKIHLWTDGERNHEWQESMAIFGPDQHPEQIIETEVALTMVDIDGNYVDYSWEGGPPPNVEKPRRKCIQHINYTGEFDPVTIGTFVDSDVYGGEVTPYAVFPTWNHWPVAQMPSDGRYASFPDRTAHSSLTHLRMPDYAADHGNRPFQEKLLMEAMLKAKPVDLVPLARSWMQAPKLNNTYGCKSHGYDQSQRAYILTANDSDLSFTIDASEKKPIVNLCFVVKNWGSKAKTSMKIDGRVKSPGSGFRQGVIRDTDGSWTLVVWVKKEATSTTQFQIEKS